MTAFLSQTLVPTLFNMSLTASIVILCVLVVRLALKRAPKVFSYALWAVVLFRLLCPVSLSSGFSLLGVLDAPARQASPAVSTVTYVQPRQPVEVLPQTEPLTVEPDEPSSDPAAPVTPEIPEKMAAPVNWAAVAAWVWLVGAVGLAGYSILALLRLRRRLVGALCLKDHLYLADHITTPFVLGLVRPKIYLPSSLNQGELGYIIRHEQYHIRHGDHVVKILAFAALCLHWFNPLVWVAFVLAGKDMEMRCDEAVVKQLGEEVRADYSASLLTLATGRLTIAGTPLAFGEGDPKGRIRNLLRWKRPKLWLSVVACIACAAVIAACAANPAGQSGATSSADSSGQYASMEDFAQQTMEDTKEVTYYTPSGEAATAQVTGTKLAWLDKQGELEGLAPEGTLEAWTFHYLVQVDAPAEEIALAGGMYEEDGWFDLEGQGGHNIVSLRYADGSYDILYDQPVNDNLDFYGYRNSYEEAIYDWYVTDQGLDLPLYGKDWSIMMLSQDGEQEVHIPVHRYDGDGWYLYIPGSGWAMRADGSNGNSWWWHSEYRGSSVYLMVNRVAAEREEILTAYQQMGYEPVDQEQRVWQLQSGGLGYRYLIEGAEGQSWEIITYCPDSKPEDDSYIAMEPLVLQLMADSFTVTEQTSARPTESQAVQDAKQNLLQELEQGAYRLEVATGQEVRALTAGDTELGWLQAMGEALLWREDFPEDFYALPGSLSLVLDEDRFFCFTPGGELGQIMVDYVADGTTTSCWTENIQIYLWLTAVLQEQNVEMHDLDGDLLLEAVAWPAGERNLVLYDCYDGQIQTLDVKQALGAEFADYTGLIANIETAYSRMVQARVDGETGVYQYDDGTLTYVCSLEDALLT